MNEKDIEKLVYLSQQGDKESFGILYEHFLHELYKYVFFKVEKVDAQDICEEIFVKIWFKIKKYDNEGNFRAWMYKIATNYIIDYYRKNKDIRNISLEDIKFEFDDNLYLSQNQKSLHIYYIKKALEYLKPQYKDIIILHYINDLDIPEIAKILDKNENNVRVMLHRALNNLKEIIDTLEK